jgi:lipid A ethanolaminephosphotransferase
LPANKIKSIAAKNFSGVDITWLTLAVSVYIILFFNISFWKGILKIYGAPDLGDIFFLLSILLSLIAAVNLIFSIFGFKYVFKAIAVLILITSSLMAFFMDSYGIMMDKNMLQNILETDSREVYELFSFKLLFYFFLFGLLPSFFVCRVKIRFRKIQKDVLLKLGIILTSAVFLGANAIVFYKDYASLSRNHRYLRFLINPSYFFYSLSEYTQDMLSQGKQPLAPLGKDATQTKPWMERGKKTITILVLGETARAENFSLNGYSRDTNPMLSMEEIVSFSNFYSCGTSTAVSLPCMFSHLGRAMYSESKARKSENLLDVLSHSGVRVLWRDNNSGCKSVCSRIETENMENLKDKGFCTDSGCYDEILLQGLQAYADNLETDAFIVLHQKGSHGPAFYRRYPEPFKKFTPVCESSQLDKCPRQDIINAYDNSILYTDYFLSRVIDFLKTNSDTFYTAMIYVSDHGESLGENNIYLHGLPYLIAPDEQRHVPFILWFSDGFQESYGIDRAYLESISASRRSHDDLFDSVLGLLDIRTKEYDPRQDIFSGAK